MKGATLGEGNGLDEEGYGQDEEEHKEGKSHRGFRSPNRLLFHGFYQQLPLASKVQDAFFRFV